VKSKHHFTYSMVDFHKLLVKQQEKSGIPKDDIISYKNYRILMEAVFLRLAEKIIYENYIFNMPYSLGSIMIKAGKHDPDKAKIDFIKTKQINKVVKFLNRHSFGYYFKFRWGKEYVAFRNRPYYNFKPIRGTDKNRIGKTGLSHHIFDIAKDPNKKSYIRI
jgi:hypothetical protein